MLLSLPLLSAPPILLSRPPLGGPFGAAPLHQGLYSSSLLSKGFLFPGFDVVLAGLLSPVVWGLRWSTSGETKRRTGAPGFPGERPAESLLLLEIAGGCCVKEAGGRGQEKAVGGGGAVGGWDGLRIARGA